MYIELDKFLFYNFKLNNKFKFMLNHNSPKKLNLHIGYDSSFLIVESNYFEKSFLLNFSQLFITVYSSALNININRENPAGGWRHVVHTTTVCCLRRDRWKVH